MKSNQVIDAINIHSKNKDTIQSVYLLVAKRDRDFLVEYEVCQNFSDIRTIVRNNNKRMQKIPMHSESPLSLIIQFGNDSENKRLLRDNSVQTTSL